MNKPLRWQAARLRQFRHSVKKTNRLAQKGEVPKPLQEKLRRQWKLLSQVFNPQVLMRIAAGAAMMFVMGTTQAQTFSAPVTNPFNFTPAGTQYYQLAAAADLDGDGDVDLTFSDSYGNTHLYFENTGTAMTPSFAAATNNPLGLQADTVVSSHFADMDNDGDLDAFIINTNPIEGIDFYYQENTGSATAPTFGAGVLAPFGILDTSYSFFATTADIDNDGDLDLFMGAGFYSGEIKFFENTGSPTVPVFGTGVVNPFGLTTTYYQAAPALVDFDNDGDLDMLVAEYYGGFQYFQNTGTPTAPAFAAPVANPFGLQAQTSEYYVGLATADMDGDGDIDVIMSGYGGVMYYFENTSPVAPKDPVLEFDGATVTVNELTAGTLSFDVMITDPNAMQTTVDVRVGASSTAMNGDDYTFTDPTTLTFPANSATAQTVNIPILDDFLVEPMETLVLELVNPTNGASFGTDSVYTVNIISNEAVGIDALSAELGLSISPNPASDFIEIRMKNPQDVKCALMTVEGKIIHQEVIRQYANRFDISGLTAGVYMLSFEKNGQAGTMKIMVRK
ncbi:MAG: FG-GAP-like repeat-containing protein [Bacteroidia bacterium]